jgi:hypothetical protein
MKYLRIVPPPAVEREDLTLLARKGALFAARRLRNCGIDDPEAAMEIARIAMDELTDELTDGSRARHAHAHAESAITFGRLCAAIERLIDRGAGQAGGAN